MMKKCNFMKAASFFVAAATLGGVSGCANYEVNSMRGNIPGYWIRSEMQVADRAVEAARAAGKDAACPAEFKAAEDAKNNAYDVFRACHTEEGAALAKEATAKANALCPPKKVEVAPPPPPAPVPPKPAPVPAPKAGIAIVPGTIVKGESATMTWTSENASECAINPEIGTVPPQGSRMISAVDNTTYRIVCSGAGGTADSAANINVTAPAPPPPPVKLCQPTVIDIQFDTDKSDIKARYHDELKKLADFLAEYPKATGVIEGHTDSIGGKDYNQKLSQRRAESVRSYLIKNFGIAPERIGAKGYGLARPVADNKTADGRRQNRRIEANFNCNM